MTGIVFPVDAVSGAPTYTGRNLRDALSSALQGATAARPMGAASGVRPGTASSTVTATSSTWTVQPHAGVVDAESSGVAGPYWYAFDAVTTGSMNAPDSTYSRIDLISVQVSDPAESDGTSAPSAAIVYTVGTPAATPAVPSAPARSLVLAQITVPKTGAGSPAVSFNPPTLAAAGGIQPVYGGPQYPTSPYYGQYVDDYVAGLLRWNGSSWARFGVGGTDWTNVSATSGWTSSLQVKKHSSGLVTPSGNIAKASGNLSNTSQIQIGSLPSTAFAPKNLVRALMPGYIQGTGALAGAVVEIQAGATAINMTWNQAGAFSIIYFDGLVWST